MAEINLKEFRKENGVSQQELADYLGVGQGYVSQMERGERPIQKTIIEKIKANPAWTVRPTTNAEPKKNRIPLYDDVATIGGKNDMVADVNDAHRPTEFVDAGDWFPFATSAIHHYGDSMVEYPSGCILVLKRVNDINLLINGENYVIETDEFRITKQIQYDGGDYIMAYSSNRDTYPDGHLIHSPIRIPKESIRHLDLVLGCVIKRFSNAPFKIMK